MGLNKGTGGGFKCGELVMALGLRIFSGAGAAVDGLSGTGVAPRKAATGSKYFDRTGKVWYTNVGTATSPVWVSDPMTAVVALTNAEIKALRATPKELVAAPGAGRLLEFISALLLLDYGTNALTESTDNLGVKYHDGSGTQISETIEAGGFIDATADTMTTSRAKLDGIVAKSACENKALVLHNLGDGEFGGNAGADTVMRVRSVYRVHVTGW